MYNFTKEDTKLLKGVVLILMLAHHLFSFTSRIGEQMYPKSFTRIDGMSTAKYIGDFGQICVAGFLFLMGYGIYKSYRENQFYVVKKIYSMYLSMWKVMLIFVPVGFIWCSNQFAYCAEPKIYGVFSNRFDLNTLVSNMLGISHEYNQEWWFIRVYIVALITFPLVVRIIRRNNIWKNIWMLIVYTVIMNYIIPELCHIEGLTKLSDSYLYNFVISQNNNMTSFWMGCILAKDNVFEKCIEQYEELKLNTVLKDSIGLCMIVICRNKLIGDELDFVYIPILFIMCRDLLVRVRFVKNCFYVIGEESMNIWLIHTFFCYYFYPLVVLVYLPKYAILVLPWLVIICLITSKTMTCMYSMLKEVKKGMENRSLQLENQEKCKYKKA